MEKIANLPSLDLSELREIVGAYKEANKNKWEWEKLARSLSEQLKPIMGDAEMALVDGVPALRLSRIATRRFDETLFREDYPELHSKYIVEGTQLRLTVVKPKDV